MQHLIYQITNNINGKIYVGAHTGIPEDNYLGSGKGINAAIRKYGKEHFSKKILFECQSVDEMFQKEAEIVDVEFVKRQDTYNRVVGGRQVYAFDDDLKRQRISEAKRGKPAWNKGKKMNYSPEALARMSLLGKTTSRKGKKFSEEHRKNLSLAHMGKVPGNKGMKYRWKSKTNGK